jgi:hypothetical protein
MRYLNTVRGISGSMHYTRSDLFGFTRLILILLAALFLLPTGVWGVTVSLEPLSLHPGESGTTNLSIDSMPSGLSGFRTGLKFTTPGIAEFTDISFPAWAGLNDKTGFPGSEVSFRAADLGGSVERGAGRTVLATLTVRGITAGTTMVTFSDLLIDDDLEDSVTATAENSTVVVSAIGEVTLPANGSPSEGPFPPSPPDSTAGTTQPTLIPDASLVTGQQTSPEIPSPDKTVQDTGEEATPEHQNPVPTTPARGIPFISLSGLTALMIAFLVIGTLKRER